MADVADDCLVLHRLHVFGGDDVLVARSGAEDVGDFDRFFHRHDLETVHRRLQRADRVDFGNEHARAAISQRLRRTLADIAEAGDTGDLARQHHVGRTADRIDQRFTTAVEVVELRLGHAVVHIDRGERQLALLGEVIEAVDAGGGFFGHADDVLDRLGQVARLGGDEGLERALEFDFLGILRFGQFLARLDARAPQREHGRIAAIVEDDVGGTVRLVIGRPVEYPANVVPIVRQALALDRKYGNVLRRNSRSGVILRRENVARRPAHVGAQRD